MFKYERKREREDRQGWSGRGAGDDGGGGNHLLGVAATDDVM